MSVKIFELNGNNIKELDWAEAVLFNNNEKEEDHIPMVERLISDPEELYDWTY